MKTNWAREAALWTPGHPATVIHGDGDTIDGFADIVVVNYELLDRHVGWLGDLGFRGMVVDEAHFIKNKKSQRSQHVLRLSERIRARTGQPLLMALTGTPLINDIEDFRAIWQFLGWIEETKPGAALTKALEDTGLTPAQPGFLAAARACVIDLGIVRRRKIDVAADLPARRIADLPVAADDAAGRSIRAAERKLTERLVSRYQSALATRTRGVDPAGIDHDLVHRVAGWELADTATSKAGESVFSISRRIGQAKAALAADYTAQLARSVGKVVFFAKHIDVLDLAEQIFAERGIRHTSIRGDQATTTRQREHRRIRRRSRRHDRGLLAVARRPVWALTCRSPPTWCSPAVLDRRRADPGHRPRAPRRPGRTRHRLAHHRHADDRLEDRPPHRQQGRARRQGARRFTRRDVIGHRRAPRISGRAVDRRVVTIWVAARHCTGPRRGASSRASAGTERAGRRRRALRAHGGWSRVPRAPRHGRTLRADSGKVGRCRESIDGRR